RSLTCLLVFFTLISSAPAAAQSCRNLLDSKLFFRPSTETNIDFMPRRMQKENILHRLRPEQLARFRTIQEVANRVGITIAIAGERMPTRNERLSLEQLFGAPVFVVTESTKAMLKKLKGVVLHLGFTTELMNYVRGDLNPTYTDARTLRRIEEGDKWLDYALIQRVAPGEGLMAKSLSVEAIPSFQRFLQLRRGELTTTLTQALKPGRTSFNEVDRIILKFFIRDFFTAVEFELGPSFVKYNGEAQTGDAKDTVTTFKTTPESLVATFEADFFASKKEVEADQNDLQHPSFLMALKEKDHSATYLFKSLLFRPRDIMVQERLELAKYDGISVEVRIDVMRGIPLTANSRFGYHYLPPEILAQALEFTTDFFARLPPEWKLMSAGVDVAFVVKDGKTSMKVTEIEKRQDEDDYVRNFMEFNFGSDSGFIFAKGETIEANEWLSTILGRPTNLINLLEVSYLSGLEGQQTFFSKLSPKIKKEKKSLSDISHAEYAGWLVYRYMEDWNGTKSDAQRIRRKLELLFQGHRRENSDLTQILRSLDIYISRMP
ncbi:MAG: hypothetical protein ABL958_20150, partial [Bdellovibrionia bacterium]